MGGFFLFFFLSDSTPRHPKGHLWYYLTMSICSCDPKTFEKAPLESIYANLELACVPKKQILVKTFQKVPKKSFFSIKKYFCGADN